MTDVDPPGPFQCRECGDKFPSEIERAEHRLVAHFASSNADPATLRDKVRYHACWFLAILQFGFGLTGFFGLFGVLLVVYNDGPVLLIIAQSVGYLGIAWALGKAVNWLADDWWFPDGGIER